jgi:CRP-like cAMP-binding protein
MATDWLPLLKGLRATRRELATDEVLFHAGDVAGALYLVESGGLRLMRGTAPTHSAGPGTLIGEAGLFTDCHAADAVAVEPSRIASYAKTAVLLHLRAHADLALAFAACLARVLDSTRAQLELMRLKTARERVLAFLAQAGAAERPIILDRPLTLVAAEIGLTHEALYRTLARLTAEGLLERHAPRGFRLIAPLESRE